MNFINPGFLFALFTLLIPVIIHLFNFRKYKRVYFSNVKFLKQVQTEKSSRDKLKNRFILASRMLALLFLVLAFAQPFTSSGLKKAEEKPAVVHIYLDNSYSMQSMNREGVLLDVARNLAVNIAREYDLNTKFRLITNDFEAAHHRPLGFDEFRDAVGRIKSSAASRTLQDIVQRQAAVTEPLYIISDFQKSFTGRQAMEADSNARFSFIQIRGNAMPNVTVDSVWFLSPLHQPNGQEKLVIRLKNYGNKDALQIPVKLIVNNQQKAVSSLNVQSGKLALDTFHFSGLSAGWQRAKVEIRDEPLHFDNQLYFTFLVSQQLEALSINGEDGNRYLKALFEGDKYVQLTEAAEGNVPYSQLKRYNSVFLSQLKHMSSGLASSLNSYVEEGGNLIVFPKLTAPINLQNDFLTTLGLPAAKYLIKQEMQLSAIESGHPFFKDLFAELPANLDLPLLSAFYEFESGGTSKESLIALPNGKAWMSKFSIGKGSVYLFASGLSSDDSNLPKHPLFVPMMYKMVISSNKEAKLYYSVGQDSNLEVVDLQLSASDRLALVSESRHLIPSYQNIQGKASLYVADQIRTPGFYTLKKGEERIQDYAFNMDARESDMQFSKKSDIEAIMGNLPFTFVEADKEEIRADGLPIQTHWWKWCLGLSLFFLLTEILIIKFCHKIQAHKSNEFIV